MRRILIALTIGISLWLLAGPAMADHEVGPVWNSRHQNVVCMATCDITDEPPVGQCIFTMEILAPDASVLMSEDFTLSDNNAMAYLVYKGDVTPVVCITRDSEVSPDFTPDTSVSLVRKKFPKGKVDAMSIPD